MQIDRIEEMRMSDADETGIGQLLDLAFDNGYDGRSFFQQRHHVRFVVRDDNAAIIGHMALCLRAIRLNDQLVHIAGLAEVATHPAHRGRGIATALMTAVITEARASPAAFLVLFGENALYTATGFVSMPKKTISISLHDVKTGVYEERTGDKLMILPLGDREWDQNAVVDLVGHAF